ncbi:MAG: hypothetical protein U0V48_02980 [Anaerolineales bacterium]
MPDLFDHAMQERMKSEAPLAARMRPRTLDEYIGQEHIVGEGKLLWRAIKTDKLFSPSFCGDRLAQARPRSRSDRKHNEEHFVTISAILAGKADLRVIIDKAMERRHLHNDPLRGRSPSLEQGSTRRASPPCRARSSLSSADDGRSYYEVNKALISRSRMFNYEIRSNRDRHSP